MASTSAGRGCRYPSEVRCFPGQACRLAQEGRIGELADRGENLGEFVRDLAYEVLLAKPRGPASLRLRRVVAQRLSQRGEPRSATLGDLPGCGCQFVSVDVVAAGKAIDIDEVTPSEMLAIAFTIASIWSTSFETCRP